MVRNLILSALMCASVIPVYGADEMIFSCQVGSLEVHLLVENRGQGRSSVLVGANQRALNQYVPGGVYQSQTNTFLIKNGSQAILIDTGFGTTVFESLSALGLKPEDISAVLITHLHGDHIGGLARDGRALFPQATVYLAQQERDYWTRANPNAGAVNALAAYPSRVEAFTPGELGAQVPELLPGIRAFAAFGHTPGHTVYMVESQGQRLLIVGDLLHVEDIQFPMPAVTVTYDTDQAAAAEARRRVLNYAAANALPIGGMHLRYPSVGLVQRSGNGYRFTPQQ